MKFEMAEDCSIPWNFVEFRVQKGKDDTLELNQEEYVRKLRPMPTDGSYSEFASLRMKLAWLAHSRPDWMFEASQMTPVTRERFGENEQDIGKRVNRTVRYVQETPACICFQKLSKVYLYVLGLSDALFASNLDSTSQLGYICLLADNTGNVIPIQFKSYKARRVTRSVVGAELMAFSDMSDAAYTLAAELRELQPNHRILVKLFTDNESLFDVIWKGSRTSEKKLMLDIATARDGLTEHEISYIGFVRSDENIADGLTKPMKRTALCNMLLTGMFRVKVERWIVRRSR